MLLFIPLFAEYKDSFMTQQMLDSNIKIIDIRTEPEWKETGLLKNVIPIMFFNEKGSYNINEFLKELNAKIDTSKPFALICHTGSRTAMLAPFLSKELHYDVTNILGGMEYATKGLKMATYPFKRID